MFSNRLIFVVICSLIILMSYGCDKNDGESVIFRHSIKDPSALKILNELIDEFNKEHNTNIIQSLADDDDIEGVPDSSWDIAIIPAHRTAWYALSGLISELHPSDSLSKTINRFSKDVSFYQGEFYSIPLFMDIYTLLSNNKCINIDDLSDFSLLPYSSDFSINPDSIQGFAVPAFGKEAFHSLVFFLLLNYQIADSANPVFSRLPININNINLFLQSGYETSFESQSLIINELIKGRIASCLSNSSFYTYASNFTNPEILASELPAYLGKPANSLIYCSSIVVNSKSNKLRLAEKFISFLISDKNLLKLAKEIKYLGFPANINLVPKVKETDKLRAIQYKQLNHAIGFGSNPSFYLIEKYLDTNLGECINSQISPWEILSNISSIQDRDITQ